MVSVRTFSVMYDYTFLNLQISSRSDIRPHITEHPSSPLHLADVCCMFAVHSNKQWSNHWHKHIHTTTSVVHILKLRLIDGWAVIIFKLRYLMVSMYISEYTRLFSFIENFFAAGDIGRHYACQST